MYARALAWVVVLLVSLSSASVQARELTADPTTLRTVLPTLIAGDTLTLAPGNYAGRIQLDNLNGTVSAPIIITGPSSGAPAIVVADPGPCCNMIEIRGSSYLILRHITLDGGSVDGAFGVSAGARGTGGSGTNVVHHITIEDSRFLGFDGSNNHDAISTKTPTWGWVLRRNTFEGAGIAAYFGDSTGNAPFIGGLIEHNAFLGCLGYCMQIKFQNPRPTDWPGLPVEALTTRIRHNVFVHLGRADLPARPSLLVGGFPASGLGSEDRYEIYGNVFLNNATEALLQASGRVSIHDNVFVNDTSSAAALVLQNHDLPLRRADVYQNTFYVRGTALALRVTPDQGARLVGNAIFAGTPRSGSGTYAIDASNVEGSLAMAPSAWVAPAFAFGALDVHPTPLLMGPAIDLSAFAMDSEADVDFECRPRGARAFRGAYMGPADARSWMLQASIPPDLCGAAVPSDAGVSVDAGTVMQDAGVPSDAARLGGDVGATPTDSAGCGCRAGRPMHVSLRMLFVALIAVGALLRRRAPQSSSTARR